MSTKHRNASTAGLTLIEMSIVVSLLVIIASIAIPNLIGARLSANEMAALATLRTISSAQAQFQSGAKIDTDRDGAGEYGYFGELSGGTSLRDHTGGVTGQALKVPILSSAFRVVNNGLVTRGGYVFQLLLPNAGGVGVGEAANGGADAANLPNANMCEVAWCCYAWPVRLGNTGWRVFFVNQKGDIVLTSNKAPAQSYSGTNGPPPHAAFVSPTTTNGIVGVVAVSTIGSDGGRWVPAK